MSYQESAKVAVMDFLSAYANRDIVACMSLIAKNRPLLIVGTNTDEVCKSQAEIQNSLRRDFENMLNFQWGSVKYISLNAEEALASVLLELPASYLANDKQENIVLRYAFTLVKENGDWRIAQALASLPAPAGSYNFSSWE